MSRETIRDRRGQIIGYIERQSITRRRIARDAHGVIVATYDARADTTRDARGVLVGHGDFLLGFLDRP